MITAISLAAMTLFGAMALTPLITREGHTADRDLEDLAAARSTRLASLHTFPSRKDQPHQPAA